MVIGRRIDVADSGELEALADAAYERFGAMLSIVEPGSDQVTEAIQNGLDHVSARNNPSMDFGIV